MAGSEVRELLQGPQALFIDPKGIYPALLGADRCWDEARDARTYAGDDPVVAHPPCQLWVNMAAQNYARAKRPCPLCLGVSDWGKNTNSCPRCAGTGRREPNRSVVLPAWYPGGDDGECFASALASVRKYGGVLEHPAGTHAWAEHGLHVPTADVGARLGGTLIAKDARSGWTSVVARGQEYWVCEVWQSAYGHPARKRTWLLYCGKRPPFDLKWDRNPGTHQVGWFDRNKPTVSKREASATPRLFAEALIHLAAWSQHAE